MVELKNGETLNGLLTNCDSWMNLTLSEVIQTSPDGQKFLKIPEVYVRGTHIKYLRLPDQSMDHAKEQSMISMDARNKNNQRRRGNNNFRRGGRDGGRDYRDNREGGRDYRDNRDGGRDGGREYRDNREGGRGNFRRNGHNANRQQS